MHVIVDTVIWSLALRRKEPDYLAQEALRSLIDDQRVLLLGPVRQEVLSGFSNEVQFNLLNEKLSSFENENVADEDYLVAAKFYNICRKKGIQGSHVDFLICAVAYRMNAEIYTTDGDFDYYSKHLPINLYLYYT